MDVVVGVFFFQAEDGIRDVAVTGVQTCALPILLWVLRCRLVPRGAQPSGQRQPDLVSFADEGKKEHASSAVSTTTRRPAEVLREGSGIKVETTAGDGLTISRYNKRSEEHTSELQSRL